MASPFYQLYGKYPDYSSFRILGCKCFPYLGDYRKNKLEPKFVPCIFMGYSVKHKGYKCFAPSLGRTYISRHVVFDESCFPFADPNSLYGYQSTEGEISNYNDWMDTHVFDESPLLAGNGTNTSPSSSYNEDAMPTTGHSLDGLHQSYANGHTHATSMEEICRDTMNSPLTQSAATVPVTTSPSNQSVDAEPQLIDMSNIQPHRCSSPTDSLPSTPLLCSPTSPNTAAQIQQPPQQSIPNDGVSNSALGAPAPWQLAFEPSHAMVTRAQRGVFKPNPRRQHPRWGAQEQNKRNLNNSSRPNFSLEITSHSRAQVFRGFLMALSIPFSANSHVSFFCLLIFVLMYLEGVPVYGAKREHGKPYHVVNVKSLDPNPYCIESTKDQSKRESLKVVHRHGPCSHTNEAQTSAPTLAEIMSHDQARVDSLQHRLRVKSDRNSLDDSKATLPAKSGESIGTGNYIVTLGFGTPKNDLTLTFDTGSDVTWIQCEPCICCYEQEEPIFNPSASQTYKNISCTSPQCSQDLKIDCTESNTCVYGVGYLDKSFTIGLYATETLTLTPSDVFPGFAFGCGLNNTGLFRGAAGLLGLGRGPPSLVTQTASKYGSYFSYCLPTLSSSSGTLVFGKDGGTTNSAGIKYTPLLTNSNGPSFYFIEVVGIKVGGELLPISQSAFSSPGTVIDSGTVITRLQPEAYDALRTRFRQLTMNYTMTQGVSLFDTCYDFSGRDTVEVPEISFLFAGNIEVPIAFEGILYYVGSSRFCLAFAGNMATSAAGIFGNVQQQTLDVVYDVAGGKLGFGTGGCS
ncbi:hypothetical protein RHSIM_Rhsim02G0220400 [Rhododendron simsii]|uniref:Peptidase A1 domain-containing protein n=1 Tax=Rhododendron simsii TaxID=118357 RepID=A0A834HD87_RHOSS|nr:hypothetical protein RHSIM_Rhsim02G0220400 [Rhododendron simsii]